MLTIITPPVARLSVHLLVVVRVLEGLFEVMYDNLCTTMLIYANCVYFLQIVLIYANHVDYRFNLSHGKLSQCKSSCGFSAVRKMYASTFFMLSYAKIFSLYVDIILYSIN